MEDDRNRDQALDGARRTILTPITECFIASGRPIVTIRGCAVRQSLSQMWPQDIWRSLQVGDGSRQFENAMKTSRGKSQTFRSITHQIPSGLVEPNDFFHQRSGGGGVARNVRMPKPMIALPLNVARGGDAHRDFRRSLRRRRQDQIRGANGGNLQMEVDSIE
jgi:hypothetical protein